MTFWTIADRRLTQEEVCRRVIAGQAEVYCYADSALDAKRTTEKVWQVTVTAQEAK